jgi:hypothetical protein
LALAEKRSGGEEELDKNSGLGKRRKITIVKYCIPMEIFEIGL